MDFLLECDACENRVLLSEQNPGANAKGWHVVLNPEVKHGDPKDMLNSVICAECAKGGLSGTP